MKTIVIGGGIIGAALAFRLAEAGRHVTIVAADGPAATPLSFGWINASFHLDAAHFHLRAEGLQAWRRLGAVPGLTWGGAISWEWQGEELERNVGALQSLGYPVERLGTSSLRDRVTGLGEMPGAAIGFPEEGAVSPGVAAEALLARAEAAGALRLPGARAEAIATRGGRVCGVRTDWGELPADAVVVAAGTGAPALLKPLGVSLPMVPRPGALMISHPLPRLTDAVLVIPQREIRQDAEGRLVVPGTAAHQSDESETLQLGLDDIAAGATAACRRMFPDLSVAWARMGVANRPMPKDGRPVIGAVGPEGLYLAVMHSGVTLAVVVAEALADRVAGGLRHADLVAPYDPARFAVSEGA